MKHANNYVSKFPEISFELDGTSLSQEKIKWIQDSLNRFTGFIVKIDGRLGPDTSKSLKIFQQKYGIDVTGIPDARTIEMLTKSRIDDYTNVKVLTEVRDFEFNQFKLNERSFEMVAMTADILIRLNNTPGFLRLLMYGFADPTGSSKYNFQLGLKRALEVEKSLRCALNNLKPASGDTQKLPIELWSNSESYSIRGSNPWSRRVVIAVQFRDNYYERLRLKMTKCYQ